MLEDLHWSDQSTRELVSFLIRSLRGVRVVLLATYRSDELNRRHPLRPLIASWDRLRSVQHVELRRFEPEEVAAQLGAILGADPAAGLVYLVFDRSGGNAYLVEELAGLVRGGGDPADLPPSLADVLLSRVDALSPGAQRLLRTAAVAGRSVPDKLLAQVAGVGEAEFYAGLREAASDDGLPDLRAGLALATRHRRPLHRAARLREHLRRAGAPRPARRGGRGGQGRDRAGRTGSGWPGPWALFLTGNLVESLLRLGRWSEADQLATQALNAMPEGVFAATVLQLRAELAAMTGRYADADTDMRAARRALGQTRDEQFALTLLYADALAALGRGDPGRGAAPRRRRAGGLRLRRCPDATSGRCCGWPPGPRRTRPPAPATGGRRFTGRRRGPAPRPGGARRRDLATPGMPLRAVTWRWSPPNWPAPREDGPESPMVGAWSAAARAWQAAAEPYPLAYTWLRLAEAAAAAGDRQEAGRCHSPGLRPGQPGRRDADRAGGQPRWPGGPG